MSSPDIYDNFRILTDIFSSDIQSSKAFDDVTSLYRVHLPHIKPFRARYLKHDQAPRLDHIEVPRNLRNYGIATRLLGSLALVLVEEGYERMDAQVSSVSTLKIFRSLFGDESIILQNWPKTTLESTVAHLAENDQKDQSKPLNLIEVSIGIGNPIQELERAIPIE